MQKALLELTENNKEIFWDIAPKYMADLSEEAVFERILEFGDIESFVGLIKLYGIKAFKALYGKILSKKRLNLSPKTVNFLDIYLEYHT